MPSHRRLSLQADTRLRNRQFNPHILRQGQTLLRLKKRSTEADIARPHLQRALPQAKRRIDGARIAFVYTPPIYRSLSHLMNHVLHEKIENIGGSNRFFRLMCANTLPSVTAWAFFYE